jgi:hypothetical protein
MPNPSRQRFERSLMKTPPVKLTAKRRDAVYRGIRETCKIRNWDLLALNVVAIMCTLLSRLTAVRREFVLH